MAVEIDGGECFEGIVAEQQGAGYLTLVGRDGQISIEHKLVMELGAEKADVLQK